MNISLTPELEKFIQSKVDSKMYQTASEVVREALRLLAHQDQDRQVQLEELRRSLQISREQYDRGEYIEIRNEEDARALRERIKRNGRARLAAKNQGRAE